MVCTIRVSDLLTALFTGGPGGGGGRVGEGLVQAGADGDEAVQGGEGEDPADLPAESQNRVRVMSTTRAGPGRAAAWSRAARSASALVMSISSGAITTGTPRVMRTGNLGSVIVIVVTSCGRGQ